MLQRCAQSFAPHESLAKGLLPHAVGHDDGSHDVAHLLRVWSNARTIQANEGGDLRLLAAAVLLHDCVAVEKDSPLRGQSSRLAAEKARGLLVAGRWSPQDIAAVAHAVEAHSFSAGVVPQTLEAKILQDADRLDAIGMIGAARCFYVAGRLRSQLYDPLDPQAEHRPLDDRQFAIDHFQTKLLTLASGFQTAKGAMLAQERHARLVRFLQAFLSEI
ncbi:HD domain-containing protein [Bradyrhizobium prioriisuperbiae]|uniref:HD domain-containing protein n=1 Tax=Bradyrhizobium prioriisuperbiae TaxID=2854389 RepID=UPI0028EE0350|nr:HD domain-containing protein [Bradyrhizobium prioritasuperba]